MWPVFDHMATLKSFLTGLINGFTAHKVQKSNLYVLKPGLNLVPGSAFFTVF